MTNDEMIADTCGRHVQSTDGMTCTHCGYLWACEPVQLASALEAAEARVKELEAAPEPEWEYRATTDNGAFVGGSRTTPEHAVRALQEAVDKYPIELDEQGVNVERRPRSPWQPVESEGEEA